MTLNTKSIVFKTSLVYIFITIFNVTLFNVMVWENQTGLIMDNAILNSINKGSNLKAGIDNIISKTEDLNRESVNKIFALCKSIDIKDFDVFDESGRSYASLKSGKIVKPKTASKDDARLIQTAITKYSFENKLFHQKVNKENRMITLYIPFMLSETTNKFGVIKTRIEMSDIGRQMSYLYRQCFVIGGLVAAIHLMFALIFGKMLLSPLRTLLSATQKIASGNLSIRVPIVRQDELGLLAVSFNEMSVALQRMRDEAKGANPLTGLPGNVTIARVIDDALMKKIPIAVLYSDLDNFKAYNDKYGFTKGDDAILYTKECLLTASKRNDVHDVFVGHEGGDDFVVVAPIDCWENYAKAFITTFDRGIYQFYNSVDGKNGFIESVNRRGEKQRFPLMSISVAVVSNTLRPFSKHSEIVQVVAEVKKYVKSMDGSCYAMDRRSGPIRSSTTGSGQSTASQR